MDENDSRLPLTLDNSAVSLDNWAMCKRNWHQVNVGGKHCLVCGIDTTGVDECSTEYQWQRKKGAETRVRSYVTNCLIDGDGADEWLFYVDEHGQTFCRLDGYAIVPKDKYERSSNFKESVINLPTPEQQELYEWMHNALNLRIR